MTKRGDFIVTGLLVLSAVLMFAGALALPINGAASAFLAVAACYAVLLALFLEVYARRG